jgi:GntR family transcriptional repressor for pyruvate dehydrogenase complex
VPQRLDPIQPVSASDAVRQRLLDWILARYAEGEDRLPSERILAQQLQVSRTTLREALRSLSISGLIVPRQGSGWYVRVNAGPLIDGLAEHFRFREMSLEQLMEARRITEPPIAALAAERRTPEDLAELERTYQSMLGVDTDMDRFEKLDQQFHRGLGVATQNPFFSLAVQPMLTLLREKRIGVLHGRGALKASNREHGAVLQAVRDGDPQGAHAAMAFHLSSFIRRVGAPKND